MGDILLEKALAIEGWMSPTELTWLAETAQNCHKILEVGSYKGRSTRALVDNCPGKVIAVDPWSGPYYTIENKVLFDQSRSWNDFQRNLGDAGNLVIVKDTYENFLRIYGRDEFDMIFLDGDHRYESVRQDILNSLGRVKRGGILAGHDYEHGDWPGVRQAVDEFFPNVGRVSSIWWIRRS